MELRYLYINSRDEFYRVDFSQIVFFEAEGNCVSFTLRGKQKGVVGVNLMRMQEMLTGSLKEKASIFARVGKRFIVNLNFVYHIEPLKQKLTLSDGATFAFQLSVSKEALKKLKEMYVASISDNNDKTE